jgi:hypothetical protein
MSSTIVLLVGKRRVDVKKLVDEDAVDIAERREDALLFQWQRDVEDLHPAEEAGDDIVDALGADVLRWHKDERGVLVVPVEIADLEGAYAEIVAAHAKRGRWLPNYSNDAGNDPMRELRESIPVPDVPKSKKVELFVMAPGRAVRELPLVAPPLRVVCLDKTTELEPKEVAAFYVPLLKKLGFATKRRVFSDGSAEQVIATKPGEQVIVHAERTDGGTGTFVRVAAVLNS